MVPAEIPFLAGAVVAAATPPGAATIAAYWAWATLSASAGDIGWAFPPAAEKNDSRST